MAWTEQAVEILEALWTEGRSAREIAGKLGVTRNAVIGKANRLGLSHNSSVQARCERLTAKPGRERPPSSPLDLTERMCRWPLGHPGDPDFHFCGRARVTGRPYCEKHCALAYRGRSSEAA